MCFVICYLVPTLSRFHNCLLCLLLAERQLLSIGKILIFIELLFYLFISSFLFTTHVWNGSFIYGIIKFGFFRCSLQTSTAIITYYPHWVAITTHFFLFSLALFFVFDVVTVSFTLLFVLTPHVCSYTYLSPPHRNIGIDSRAIFESFTHFTLNTQYCITVGF